MCWCAVKQLLTHCTSESSTFDDFDYSAKSDAQTMRRLNTKKQAVAKLRIQQVLLEVQSENDESCQSCRFSHRLTWTWIHTGIWQIVQKSLHLVLHCIMVPYTYATVDDLGSTLMTFSVYKVTIVNDCGHHNSIRVTFVWNVVLTPYVQWLSFLCYWMSWANYCSSSRA